jgi:hypothetical protein
MALALPTSELPGALTRQEEQLDTTNSMMGGLCFIHHYTPAQLLAHSRFSVSSYRLVNQQWAKWNAAANTKQPWEVSRVEGHSLLATHLKGKEWVKLGGTLYGVYWGFQNNSKQKEHSSQGSWPTKRNEGAKVTGRKRSSLISLSLAR